MTEIYVLAAAWTGASFGLGFLSAMCLFCRPQEPVISQARRQQLDALMARTAR